jgi:phytoene desaturase
LVYKLEVVKKKRIAIIGAGPGGLTSALLLAHQGHDVTLFEAHDRVGGRSSLVTVGDYRFDAGPTFFIYRPILDEVFQTIGKKLDDYVTLIPVDPLYDLVFPDKTFTPYSDETKMLQEIQKHFPNDVEGYRRYRIQEAKRLKRITPILQTPFSSLLDYLRPKVVQALPELDLGKSLYDRLKTYFKNEQLIFSMAFQAKYLGMSPYEAPSLFSILSFMEHAYGLYHIQGGLYHLNEAMANLAQSMGVTLRLNHKLVQTHVAHQTISKLVFSNGYEASFDDVVFNGDFASIIQTIPESARPSYTNQKLAKLNFSCSTFTFYLGLDRTYDLKHHTIVFAKDYPAYLKTLKENKTLTDDLSYYIHNPTLLDASYAPPGHSNIFVLVPVPNLKAPIDWTRQAEPFYEKILQDMERRLGLKDIHQHIKAKKIISPLDWKNDYFVEHGANFNLSHSLNQMLYFRPHNQYNDIKNLYLVGGGTHPGSGLPTIYQSSLITAKLIKN